MSLRLSGRKNKTIETPSDQSRWQQAMDEVQTLDEYPDFRAWLKEGMVSGFGVGRKEPWTTFSAEGYR